jgi:hypothetical protein
MINGVATILAAAGIGVIALAGCGSSQVLNSSQVERNIESKVNAFTGVSVTATCPSDIPLKRGQATVCTVKARDGTKANVHVLETNNNGRAHISSVTLVRTTAVERNVAHSASGKLGFALKVTCPDLSEAIVGSSLHCKATDSQGATKPVTITFHASGYSYKLR